MKEYLGYKSWWLEHCAESFITSLYWDFTKEMAFEQHVKDLGLYGLMEMLSTWSLVD